MSVASSTAGGTPFRDAEAWLAERGIQREPIRVEPLRVESTSASEDRQAGQAAAGAPHPDEPADGAVREPDSRTAELGAAPSGELEPGVPGATSATAEPGRHGAGPGESVDAQLDAEVAEAVAFVRSSTAQAPQSEGRLRAKLGARGWSEDVVEAALTEARRVRLVDDLAMARALAEERSAKGHAPARIRHDLRGRGFDAATIDAAVARAEAQDQDAAAFAVAQDRAASLTGVAAEVAYRRVVAYVARRGYPESLARKVARDAVYTARDAERTAGH